MTAFARTAETLLRVQLDESPYLALLARDEMERAWQRSAAAAQPARLPDFLSPQTARQIALRCGSPYVLYGNMGQTGDERLLRVRLELLGSSVLSAKHSSSQEFILHEDRDLLDTVYKAARWVRLTVGESEYSIAAHFSRPEELTTPSWEALKEYSAGDYEWKAGRPGPAILHFKTALAIDDQFAAACTRLADIYMANGQPDDAYVQYATATKLRAARNLTDRESFLGRGMFALDVGLNQEADDVFARYILEYPSDPLPKFYRAAALGMLNRHEEAERLLAEAVRLAPSNYSFVMGCSRHFLERGDLDSAQKYWERGRALQPSDWTDQIAMAIAFARNDIAAAAGAVQRMRVTGNQEFQSKSFALEACLLGEQERWPEAEAILRQGLDFDNRTGIPLSARSTKQRMLCQVLLSQNENQLARCACLDSLKRAPGYESRLQIAGVLARTGDFPLDPNDLCDIAAGKLVENTCSQLRAKLWGSSEFLARSPCMRRNIPAWPIYEYWERRLLVELALSKRNIAQARRMLPDIPEPPVRHVFPDHVLRVARAAKDGELEKSTLQLLTSELGRWWLEPERNAPGFVRAAEKALG
jgi:tetratricopeptide (TPR) repeat protein